jgi:tetratricopeptide (TPR) repeat protein
MPKGSALGNLGAAYNSLGQTDKAIDYYEQYISILEEFKSPNADAVRQWLAELKDQQDQAHQP